MKIISLPRQRAPWQPLCNLSLHHVSPETGNIFHLPIRQRLVFISSDPVTVAVTNVKLTLTIFVQPSYVCQSAS